MSNKLTISFQNVQVLALPRSTGVAGEVEYDVTLTPAVLVVTEPDTIVNYQLVAPTPPDVCFTGATITPTNDQLSPPTISKNGRNLTFSDINTAAEDFTVIFEFNGQPASRSGLRAAPDLENRPDLPPPPPLPEGK